MSIVRHWLGSGEQASLTDVRPGSVLRLAVQHGISGIVTRELGSRGLLSKDETAGLLSAQSLRNIEIASATVAVINTLARSSITGIVVKGPVLARMVYGDIGLRDYVDVDVVVPNATAEDAVRALTESGYQVDLPESATVRSAVLEARSEIACRTPDGRVAVELHHRLFPRYRRASNEDMFWACRKIDHLWGAEIPTLRNEHAVLWLAFHGAKHAWSRLLWLVDIARLATVSGIDWEEVSQLAQQFRLERAVHIAFSLVESILRVGSPLRETNARTRMRASALRRVAECRLESGRTASAELRDHWFALRVEDAMRDRIHYVMSLALRPTELDYRSCALPMYLHWLYTPIHAVRVTSKVASAAFRQTVELTRS